MADKHNKNLDILRGLLALIVVIDHLNCVPLRFDHNYGNLFTIVYNFPSTISVLVFFILSGYVIGLNHPTLSDRKEINSYIKKRVTRIFPIYAIAILFTVLISWGEYSFPQVLSNLFFLSVPLGNIMENAFPLWSLHYEVFCYALFIVISYFNFGLLRTLKVLLIIAAFLFVFFHKTSIHPLLINYLLGYIFWLTGAALARIKTFPHWHIKSSRMISIFLLMFCLQNFNPYGPVLKVLHFSTVNYSAYHWYQSKIPYSDMFFYPLTILFILSLTHSYSRICKFLVWFLFIACSGRLFMLIEMYGLHYLVQEHYVIPSFFLLLSMACWVSDFELGSPLKKEVKSTAALSGISYAMYIIHMPLIVLFSRFTATSVFYFVTKFVLFWIVLFGVSYLLEEKLQPFIKKLVKRSTTIAPDQKKPDNTGFA